ncbi:hypothetical protein CAPTEDRAFT_204347 [Capitella teleta]|uniref:CRAL-TRIO domain-containing protein n=1 Tax=Capitella teleta TaxID=283909 RepID=R7V1D8_CAPTE|nr:hypothetical protein CAPTEDRAFT_204347 [Capitella teleta]|eukprot:ELU12302.1 hypothetical protein CAPTEDRAFT_204347 [Capitella teleta]
MATNGEELSLGGSDVEFLDLQEKCQILSNADPTQVYSEACLKRLLKAFESSESAFSALLKTQKWRREYGVETLSQNEQVMQEIGSRKALLLRQRDFKGRPILYISAKRHNANERDIEVLTKFIVHMLETSVKRCDESVIDNLCIVFDMRDFTMANMDYQFVKNLIWLLSKHYPERLGVCLIINAPRVFHGCWTVIKPWLHEVTASKVLFVNDELSLCEYLNPDFLPTDD